MSTSSFAAGALGGLYSLCLLSACGQPRQARPRVGEPVHVSIETELGAIVVALRPDHAPLSTRNFLRYVDAGFYTEGHFHRTVRLDNQPGNNVLIEVIQAGIDPRRESEGYEPILLERTSTTGLKHIDGAISMARLGPDTATSDFFICIGDQPELDYGGARNPDGQGFAAFGQVLRGRDVLRRIQASPSDGQALTPPVAILRISRTSPSRAP